MADDKSTDLNRVTPALSVTNSIAECLSVYLSSFKERLARALWTKSNSITQKISEDLRSQISTKSIGFDLILPTGVSLSTSFQIWEEE